MPHVPYPSGDIGVYKKTSYDRANDLDFQFFADVQTSNECPEFNGYNAKLCREQGHVLKPKTKVLYLPLIDKPPADPSTIMKAMLNAKAVTEGTGQEFIIFTADQQLYRIAIHVFWENQALFQNFFLWLPS